ncbi:MAG: hypothetical protein E7405_05525 [Ruminococcaceae bacterium]|nr:hypothetical protein [Oscillospiraceae bacterium]
MKKFVIKFMPWVLLIVMFALLIPGITLRVTSEEKNNNVIISFNYDGASTKLTESKLNDTVLNLKNMGVNSLSIMEDNINYFVSKGDLTCIKYNVLCHKYDEQSIKIAEKIKSEFPDISYDSHVVLIGKENIKERFNNEVHLRYGDDEYKKIGSFDNLDIYVFFDGRKQLWDYPIGYSEEKIAALKNEGFNIVLIHKLKNAVKTEYIDEIEKLIKKYDIKYLNLKEDTSMDKKYNNEENYKKMADVINNNDLTLVVTENVNQLSNQKFYGYSYVYDEVMKKGGSNKILRSYETYDETQADETKYKFRVEQFVNSTVDRNIRFVTVTLIEPEGVTYNECADNTLKAVKLYKEKIEDIGFSVNLTSQRIDYNANKPFNYAVCLVIMIMFMLLAFNMILGSASFKLTIVALLLSLVAFLGTLTVMPEPILALYPTAYSVILPAFCSTLTLSFIKRFKYKLSALLLAISSIALVYSVMLIGAVAQGTMLSGIDYYINNDIFRGIKLSLIVPTLYTAVIYYFMFIKNEKTSVIKDVKNVLNADIKVYWVILAGILGAVGVYYIIRSGNVNSISSMEKLMRSTLTEIFYARPRTKEFLIGYPCLVLFAYYVKNCNIKFINWALAVGASILITSVSNSFCHVFTDFFVIVERTLNGLFVGMIVSAFVYIGNIILFKVIDVISKKYFKKN